MQSLETMAIVAQLTPERRTELCRALEADEYLIRWSAGPLMGVIARGVNTDDALFTCPTFMLHLCRWLSSHLRRDLDAAGHHAQVAPWPQPYQPLPDRQDSLQMLSTMEDIKSLAETLLYMDLTGDDAAEKNRIDWRTSRLKTEDHLFDLVRPGSPFRNWCQEAFHGPKCRDHVQNEYDYSTPYHYGVRTMIVYIGPLAASRPGRHFNKTSCEWPVFA